VIGFFREVLCHTKGRFARKPFALAEWQADDIVAPLFGIVRWDAESKEYVRRYRIAFIELARKNGKALDVDTPILAERGWATMGELTTGDRVHAEDGSLTAVQWVSGRHIRPAYMVRFADGAQIVAADDHKWTVNDRHIGWSRVVTTAGLADDPGRYSVTTPGPVVRTDVDIATRIDVGPTNAIVAVEPAGDREVVCIAVEHPSHVFLAGRSLTPTHNSELLAGVALYLLVADDEEGAEIYGCALDRDQARKVFDVAERMVRLSSVLRKRLQIYKQAKRIVDERTGSFYEIVAADSAGNLGHNPSGIIFDELEVQKDDGLWTAMRTAMGARLQPLMIAAGTAGTDGHTFAANEHAEAVRIAEDPDRAPHVFTYIRNTPRDADPWDERNWPHANPALGSFLSIDALREEALEAKNDPSKEQAFRQFRLNQWTSQSHRWMPMTKWVQSCGNLWLNPVDGRRELIGRVAYGGLDLAAKFDLTAFCLLIPGDTDESPVDVLWRFWLPEGGIERLDKYHDGLFSRWVAQGWITATDGGVIDYDRVTADIAIDGTEFRVAGVDSDEWSMWPIINRVAEAVGLDGNSGAVTAYRNTYDTLSPGMDDVMALVDAQRFHHHGNPVATFCFDACHVKAAPYDPNLKRPVKPDRGAARERIDAVPTAAMAANAWRAAVDNARLTSAYDDHDLIIA
jgi:phage terminase large subunit-like protein